MYLARDAHLNTVQDATWWRSVVRREVYAERHDRPLKQPHKAATQHPASGWKENTAEWQAYLAAVNSRGATAAAEVGARMDKPS